MLSFESSHQVKINQEPKSRNFTRGVKRNRLGDRMIDKNAVGFIPFLMECLISFSYAMLLNALIVVKNINV
ncbi:hypothetical protein VIBNISO65_550021 [Vibrio nigripulchritudo SO65]|nr:hypothetical protein VIBNIAM115_1470007 [Vibrio nigripulchritudo AM115]CCN39140.1 hypothetical protein VIBNIFTn2_1000007 [Vibrio nigripulchritudo FTn2]CCN63167.1 hypothetical protein VIBNIPon4_1140007 [Vibrio nigripulchritudo POn4]CCN78329.1 hypothetical protein VIBNISO65_550021 [Vibrio nigripulchritudo SO65]